MIYLLSDIHGDIRFPGLTAYQKVAKPDDLCIILGDVGLNFAENSETYRAFTQEFLRLSCPIAFLDGNHEDYAYLDAFPRDTFCGGEVDRLSPHIVHLRRGNIYTIQGKTFFILGGCKSSAKWKTWGLWQAAELPSEKELAFAKETLQKAGNRVDYILTHKYCTELGPDREDEVPFLDFLRYIDENVTFRHWYCGHWHKIGAFDEKHSIIFDELTPLSD